MGCQGDVHVPLAQANVCISPPKKVSHSTNAILTSATYITRIIIGSIIISDVMACNLLDSTKVSEELAASIFKAGG